MSALNEGRSVNPGYTSDVSPALPTIAAAQRRPERQPRLHHRLVVALDACVDAQRRPERQPRLHDGQQRVVTSLELRSTKAGASTPATRADRHVRAAVPTDAQRRPERQPRLHLVETVTGKDGAIAQRRPERQPRLHSAQARESNAAQSAQRRSERQPRLHPFQQTTTVSGKALNEGRSVNPGYTVRM